VELQPELHDDGVGAETTGRRIPALRDLGPERVDLIDRHGHLRAARLPLHLLARRVWRSVLATRFPRRIRELVEERRHAIDVDVSLRRGLRRWLWPRLDLRLLGLGFGLFWQRFLLSLRLLRLLHLFRLRLQLFFGLLLRGRRKRRHGFGLRRLGRLLLGQGLWFRLFGFRRERRLVLLVHHAGLDLGEFRRRYAGDWNVLDHGRVQRATRGKHHQDPQQNREMQRDGDGSALAHPAYPLLRLLFKIGDERDPAKAGRTDCPHHPHDDAVIHPAVAAHENALVVPVLGDSSEFGYNFVDLKFSFLQEDLPLWID